MIFLFSSFTGVPDRYFDGYCFIESDYVFGAAGMKSRYDASGEWVNPGEDGCYVSILRQGDIHIVGADHSGFKKVFYYSQNGVYCVSNSITELVEHLRRNGVGVSIDYAQLAGLAVGSSTVATQLSSFATIFNEVRLMPSYAVLELRAGHLTVKVRKRVASMPYDHGLRSMAESWVSRFATLLQDDRISVSADLTGGTDSRVVFALLARARRELGDASSEIHLRSHVSERWSRDLAVAAEIADAYGVRLNDTKADDGARPFAPAEGYRVWKALCLGVYLPVYFPRSEPDARSVHFHGGGGENFRPFYPESSPEKFLAERVKPISPRFLFDGWRSDIRAALRSIGAVMQRDASMLDHYREFRNRIHAGRDPQYGVVMTPLSCVILDAIEGVDAMTTGQINFDLIASTEPRLLDFPYDDPAKGPSPSQLDRMCDVGPSRFDMAGHVYLGGAEKAGSHPVPGLEASSAAEDSTTPLLRLADEFGAAREDSHVVELLGSKLLEKAEKTLQEALAEGQFAHASDAKDVVRAVTAHYAFAWGYADRL